MLDHLTPFRIFILAMLLICYAVASKPIISSNDGSHFALAQSITFERSFNIDSYAKYTMEIDYSEYDGHIYSDRPPGTALLAQTVMMPSYAIERVLNLNVSERMRMAQAVFISCLLAAGNVLLIFFILIRLGCRPPSAFVSAVLFGVCSLNIRYGTVMFSHVPAAFFVLWSYYLFLGIHPEKEQFRHLRSIAFLGFIVGCAAAIEYTLVLLAPMMVLGLWDLLLRDGDRKKFYQQALKTTAAFSLGWLLGAGILFFYNWACFDHPLHTSYKYHASLFSHSHSFMTMFAGRSLEGLSAYFVNPRYRGLFITFPLLWFVIPGIIIGIRGKFRLKILVALWIFIAFTALISRHVTFSGGGTTDTRYIFFITALLYLPVGFVLDAVWDKNGESSIKPNKLRVLIIIFICLSSLLSLAWQVRLYFYFPGYTHAIDYIKAADTPLSKLGQFIKYSMPSIRYTPMYLALLLPIVGGIFTLKGLKRRRDQKPK